MGRLKYGITGLVMAMALASASYGTVPNLINFQGRLTTASGTPVTDSAYTIVFSIYDAPVGGSVVWSESLPNVPIFQGLFSVMLGTIVPFADSIFSGPTRFLEVVVGSEIILPRSQLTSVGYAQRVATLDGSSAGNVTGELIITQPNGTGKIVLGFGESQGGLSYPGTALGKPSISLYEPIDSKARPGAVGERKSMEMSGGQIIVFGSSEQDTNLIVSPNGDIVGAGQITMGLNSSSGSQTSVLGYQNSAQGDSSTIGGGSSNLTSGTVSVIAGGHGNTATSEGGTVGGGAHNMVSGPYATVSGGSENTASGSHAMAVGGESNVAGGDWSFAAGRRAKAVTHGSFVWADHEDADFAATGEDQFIVRANGGVGIGTDSPMGEFEVAGPAGDSAVNLPNSSISAPEISDEPGIAAAVSSNLVSLAQHATVPQTLSQVTVNLPSPGYVLLRGAATLKLCGTSQRNQAYIQITETPGSSLSPSARQAGPGENDSPNREHFYDLGVDQIYFRPAGVHTFFLEGLAHPQNGSGASTVLERPSLIAAYFPTSYGAVSGFVTSPESSQFAEITPVTWPNVSDSLASVVINQYYKTDLRELELAVVRAQSQAAILERRLLEARLRQQAAASQR